MNKAWQKYVDTASGLGGLTRQRAEGVVRTLVKQGEIAADRAEKAVDELLQRSEQNRKAVAGIVKTETEKAISRLGLARKGEVDQLKSKVRELQSQLASSGGAGGAPGGRTSGGTTKKSAAAKKSSAAKKSAAAKKSSAAKKSPAPRKRA